MSELDKWLGKNENSHQVIDPKDICKIIKEARLNGVETLEYGDLKISFREEKPTYHVTIPEVGPIRPETTDSSTLERQIPEQKIAEENEKILLQETINTRQQQLEELFTLEPEKFEEMLTQGELENDVQAEKYSGPE